MDTLVNKSGSDDRAMKDRLAILLGNLPSEENILSSSKPQLTVTAAFRQQQGRQREDKDFSQRLSESDANKGDSSQRLSESDADKGYFSQRLSESDVDKGDSSQRLSESDADKGDYSQRLSESDADKGDSSQRLSESDADKGDSSQGLLQSGVHKGDSSQGFLQSDAGKGDFSHGLESDAEKGGSSHGLSQSDAEKGDSSQGLSQSGVDKSDFNTQQGRQREDTDAEDNKQLDQEEDGNILNMLNEDVIQHLKNIPDHVFCKEEGLYFIKRYIEDRTSKDPQQYEIGESSEFQNVLHTLVVNQDFAVKVEQSISERFRLSHDASYWAIRYLEDQNPADCDDPYPYQERTRDAWFSQEINIPWRLRRGESRRQFRIFNVEKHQPCSIDFKTEEGDYKYFLHGTSGKNAKKILDEGVWLRRGENDKDFSDRDGFYVHWEENFKLCEEWATRTRRSQPAIIVFRVPGEFLEDDRQEHLFLHKDHPLLIKVLKYFRFNDDGNVINEISRYKTISGPILQNLRGLRNANHGSLPPGLLSQEIQMCIRHQDLADRFYSYIYGVFFYPKNYSLKENEQG